MTETLKLNIQQFNVFRLGKFLEKKGVPFVPRLGRDFFSMCTDTQIHEQTVRNIFFGWCLLFAGLFFGVFVVHIGNKCAGAQVGAWDP